MKPALCLSSSVDGSGLIGKNVIDLDHGTTNRGVDIGSSLDGFDGSAVGWGLRLVGWGVSGRGRRKIKHRTKSWHPQRDIIKTGYERNRPQPIEGVEKTGHPHQGNVDINVLFPLLLIETKPRTHTYKDSPFSNSSPTSGRSTKTMSPRAAAAKSVTPMVATFPSILQYSWAELGRIKYKRRKLANDTKLWAKKDTGS